MNKQLKVGTVVANVEGYKVRVILKGKGNDTGKIAVFAGKHIVSPLYVNNTDNRNKLIHYVKDKAKTRTTMHKNVKLIRTFKLRTHKTLYKVINTNGNLLYKGHTESKALNIVNTTK